LAPTLSTRTVGTGNEREEKDEGRDGTDPRAIRSAAGRKASITSVAGAWAGGAKLLGSSGGPWTGASTRGGGDVAAWRGAARAPSERRSRPRKVDTWETGTDPRAIRSAAGGGGSRSSGAAALDDRAGVPDPRTRVSSGGRSEAVA
jgi:hypothetical protein